MQNLSLLSKCRLMPQEKRPLITDSYPFEKVAHAELFVMFGIKRVPIKRGITACFKVVVLNNVKELRKEEAQHGNQ
jgi:hypothetical protein